MAHALLSISNLAYPVPGHAVPSSYARRTQNDSSVSNVAEYVIPQILHWLGITKIDRMLSMSK